MRGLSKTLMLCALAAAFAVAPVGALRAEQAGGGQGGGGAGAQGAAARRSIADRTDGMQKLDGFFPLYWEEATGKLFLEIPKLDQEILYVNGVGAGLGSNDIGIDRAQLSATQLVKLRARRHQDPDGRSRTSTIAPSHGAPARRGKRSTTRSRVDLVGLHGRSRKPSGRMLVDLGDFIMRDTRTSAGGSAPIGSIARVQAVYMSNTKAFPKNTEIEVTSTFITDGGGGGGGGRGGGGGGGGRRAADWRAASATSRRRPRR